MKKKLCASFLAALMIFTLASCGASGTEEKLKVGFLKGPTGIGAAYFIDQNENDGGNAKYEVMIDSDASNVSSAIISGELDIAAVPTNAAATLYNKTDGNIKIAAINTLGVLYILENGNTVNSVSDLAGKTVYATGQGSNPQYVLEYILSENGLNIGEDVFVEYVASDELAAKMASGMTDLCMLPVPNATGVLIKNGDVRIALSLEDEWEKVAGGSGVLTQGCIVARSDTVSDEALKSFMEECGRSVEFMKNEENADMAAALAAKYGIVPSENAAKAAIPYCNLVFMDDPDEMRESLTGYYQMLFRADPKSIGGSVPDDAFYR